MIVQFALVMENAVNMPKKFKFEEYFDLFIRQFCTVAKFFKVGQAQQYYLNFYTISHLELLKASN